MSRFRHSDTVLDMQGVAELLVVTYPTVRKWRERGLLPEPDYPALKSPVWWRSTIVAWAIETGRWVN